MRVFQSEGCVFWRVNDVVEDCGVLLIARGAHVISHDTHVSFMVPTSWHPPRRTHLTGPLKHPSIPHLLCRNNTVLVSNH